MNPRPHFSGTPTRRPFAGTILAFSILAAFPGAAPAEDVFLISQQSFLRVSPVFQAWKENGKTQISEFSNPVFIYMPLGKKTSLSLFTAHASAAGDSLHRLAGFYDTQATFNRYAESLKMNFTLGINLPLGRKRLTLEEFSTLYLLSLNMYRFQIPFFGQGWNASPGVAWAIPMGEKLVLGLGASFQFRGPFQPFQGMDGQYDPGDEWILTGGFDLRLAQGTLLTSDFYLSRYQEDKIDGKVNFQAGNKKVLNLQLKHRMGTNSLWLFAKYRTRDKNQVAIAGGLLPEAQKSLPDEFELAGVYRFRLGDRNTHMSLSVEGRFYKRTPAFARAGFGAVGITPEFSLSGKIKMPVFLKLVNGKIGDGLTLSGVEFGANFICNF